MPILPRSYLGLIALPLALVGACAAQRPIADSGPCNAGVCKVTIAVLDCTDRSGFTVTPRDLPVTSPNRIEWELTTDGYRFSTRVLPIDIKWNEKGVFDQPTPHGSKRFTWRDRHTDAGSDFSAKSYFYAINVVKEDGSVQCGEYDPWITNR
jgi:hypothetical protein